LNYWLVTPSSTCSPASADSEHLRLSGYWSRGITGEHRLIYRVAGKPVVLTILSAATTTEGNDD
jgi:hypothetical protein